MQILPLKFIHSDDKKLVGENLFNLARLKHLGLPVVESVVIVPPTPLINKLIEKYSRANKDLKQSTFNLKQEILRIKVPDMLAAFNTGTANKNENSFNLNTEKLWQNLLEKWSFELISKIEREEKKIHFTPQQIVFSSDFSSSGTAYFDESRNRVVIKMETGEIDFKKSEGIENIVNLGNLKLLIPQIYFWVIEKGEIKIMKLSPYTQDIVQKEEVVELENQVTVQKILPKTATKILVDYCGEVLTQLNSDALLYRVVNPDIEKVSIQIDKILNFKDSTIIFYPDFAPLPQENLDFAKTFTFFKNKKKLNCQIVLPQTFSVSEFLELKRNYAAIGIYSKGNIKIWKQFLTISDFINIPGYIDAGFDGAIIDSDQIIKLITGIDAEIFLSEPRADWVSSMVNFFKDYGFTKLIKNHKQVLITGKSVSSEELLNHFIKAGVWGIAITPNALNSLSEHISFLEKMNAKN